MRKASQIALGVILLALVGATAAPAQPPRQSAGGPGVVRLAERGDAQAQTRLVFMFETGQGLPQNYAEAAIRYRRAASLRPNSRPPPVRGGGLNTRACPGLVEPATPVRSESSAQTYGSG